MKRVSIGLGALVAAVMLAPASAQDFQKQDLQKQDLQKLSIVVFGSPSLGAFLPPVIKAQKLDEKNGLSISFEERTPDAYTAQFNSGEFSSAAARRS
jgi:NitT/TauT family transport system substrate-binding protein